LIASFFFISTCLKRKVLKKEKLKEKTKVASYSLKEGQIMNEFIVFGF
jgi:hypothetical protein